MTKVVEPANPEPKVVPEPNEVLAVLRLVDVVEKLPVAKAPPVKKPLVDPNDVVPLVLVFVENPPPLPKLVAKPPTAVTLLLLKLVDVVLLELKPVAVARPLAKLALVENPNWASLDVGAGGLASKPAPRATPPATSPTPIALLTLRDGVFMGEAPLESY